MRGRGAAGGGRGAVGAGRGAVGGGGGAVGGGGGAVGGGGGDENLFPHPRTGERRRCKRCIEGILGEGYTEARKKMAPLTLQCQKCKSSICKDNHFVVCKTCAESLMTRGNNDDDIDFNSD